MATKTHRVLPGFGLALGYTLVYLSVLILLPLGGMVLKASELGFGQIIDIALGERSLAAFRVTFGASFLAATINAFFGLIVAWILVRYPFPGKRFVDALVDLPFALPTAVAGITLATLYAGNGWLGQYLEPLGIKVAYTPLGVFRNVQRSVYDEQVRRQVSETIEAQGEGDLTSLLRGKDTWVVA